MSPYPVQAEQLSSFQAPAQAFATPVSAAVSRRAVETSAPSFPSPGPAVVPPSDCAFVPVWSRTVENSAHSFSSWDGLLLLAAGVDSRALLGLTAQEADEAFFPARHVGFLQLNLTHQPEQVLEVLGGAAPLLAGTETAHDPIVQTEELHLGSTGNGEQERQPVRKVAA